MAFTSMNSWVHATVIRAKTPEELVKVISSIPVRPEIHYFGPDTDSKSWVAVVVTSWKLKQVTKEK